MVTAGHLFSPRSCKRLGNWSDALDQNAGKVQQCTDRHDGDDQKHKSADSMRESRQAESNGVLVVTPSCEQSMSKGKGKGAGPDPTATKPEPKDHLSDTDPMAHAANRMGEEAAGIFTKEPPLREGGCMPHARNGSDCNDYSGDGTNTTM